MQISRRTLIISAVVLFVLVAAGIWVGMNLGKNNSDYTAVYLTTGDVYFGKFSWFPTPHISGAWYLQRGVDKNNQPTVGVAPFKNVPWAGDNVLYLSEKQIAMWVSIPSDSQFVKALQNPSEFNQPGQIPLPATSTPSK